MTNREGYIKKEDRKKILLLCDDIRMHSGIATMGKEFVFGLAHKFNWVHVAGALKHPDAGKGQDVSNEVNKLTNMTDSDVKLIPYNGYGDVGLVRSLIAQEKPDAIMIFTDPRYWTWLFDIEREIRSHIPIMYLNIWDDYPAPLYNKVYYNSCDLLMGISKQTVNINKLVLGEDAKSKIIRYVPHGIDENMFFKIHKDDEQFKGFQEFKNSVFENRTDIEYVVMFNSRNIRRKSVPDLIFAYRLFCDKIGKEEAKKCALILHTQSVDQNGTDLRAVRENLCDPEYVNVYFSEGKLTTPQMNWLYNLADLVVLPSSNEGWGLALTEAMMSETMIAANVTGGMQDQMRFTDDKGEWFTPSKDIPSNHRGTYKEHGEWSIPIFPSNISLVGSVPTPYIFDDRCSAEDIAEAIFKSFSMTPEDRLKKGKKGREWVTSEEAQMSSKNMSKNIGNCIDECFENFIPRPKFDFIKVEDLAPKYTEHKLIY